MSKRRGFGRATKSARACYSQVINVRFQPAASPRNFGDGTVGVRPPPTVEDGKMRQARL